MNRMITAIVSHLPRRRRRFWRHVSGRRRRVGVVLFAAVILGVYGWWHFTNDRRVRTTAEAYLHKMTGASVRIRAAHFSLFEGIRLEGVRLFYRDGSRVEDLFEAREVLLRHRPVSLLSGGSLEVTEIVCIAGVLTMSQDAQDGTWNVERLLRHSMSVRLVRSAPPLRLPAIRLRDGRVVFCEVVQGGLLEVGRLSLNASAEPLADRPAYAVELEGPDGRGQGLIDIATGETRWTGDAPWRAVSRALPRQYRQLAARYGLQGNLQFTVEHDPAAAVNRLSVTLSDVSMTLPPEEGGLALENVAGTIVITDEGIQLENLAGTLPQWDGAPVRATGRLRGLDASGELAVTIEADLVLPLAATGQEKLDRMIGRVQRQVRPSGPAAVSVKLERQAGPDLRVTGQLRPRGMTVMMRAFPYRVDGVEGLVDFDATTLYLRRLTGARGAAAVTVTGRIDSVMHDAQYDLTVRAEDLALDDSLRAALWESVQPIYDAFRPAGRCDVTAHVHGPDADVQADVDIDLARKASLAICPDELRPGPSPGPDAPAYRLEEMSGHIRVVGPALELDMLRGRCGPTALRLEGTVSSFRGRHPNVELNLGIEGLELDERLASALGGEVREVYDSFSPGGAADLVGTVRHREGRLEDFDLTTTLKGAAINYSGFPYPLRDATGVLHLTPQRVTVERVTGRAGRGRLRITGEVRPGREVGIDLNFDASAVELDRTLRQALPEEAAVVWDRLAPHGVADATVELHLGPPAESADQADRQPYRIRIDSSAADGPGIGIRCADLPYPLEHIRGVVRIEPGLATATDVTAGAEDSPIRLAGTLRITEGRIELVGPPDEPGGPLLTARNLPVDDGLLAALPGRAEGPAALLSAGGSVDLAIRELVWDVESTPATAPASGPSTAAACWPWRIDAQVGLREVAVGGPDGLRLTGTVDVQAGGQTTPDRPPLEAAVDLKLLEFQGRQLQRVQGRLVRPTAEPVLRLLDFQGQSHGGRLAGAGELSFGSSTAYRLTIHAEQVDLAQLLAGDDEAGSSAEPMSGKLAGRLALRGVWGQVRQREAGGQLVITDGRLFRVPVVLGLVNTIFLQLPTSDAFSSGQIEYLLRGNDLTLGNIYLAGANASILGSGRVDLASEQVHLVFVSGAPRLVPPVFAELWQLTAEGLLPTHVTGTWREPRTRTVPLSELRNLLQEIGASR